MNALGRRRRPGARPRLAATLGRRAGALLSVVCVVALTGAAAAREPRVAELDPRAVPWGALRRLALEAGLPPPDGRPVAADELARLLEQAAASGEPALADADERAALARLLDEYADGGGAPARASLRVALRWSELGDVAEREAGLPVPAGLGAALEPSLMVGRGCWWAGAAARWRGRLAASGAEPAAALLYAGWPAATGLPQRGAARQASGAWRLEWPRAAAGARWGRWAVAAGWQPLVSGPGESGGLLLAANGPSFPSVTVRRTAPFAWGGWLRRLAPASLLLRGGRVSARSVTASVDGEPRVWRDEPWFTQWELGLAPAGWLDLGASLTALAVPREGSLLPDLLQVDFPPLDATWKEVASGPVTDRLVAVRMGARWRRAPWPLLPRAAGRVYWEYGGEDFNPPGDVPLLPQISAPASVIGCELIGLRWDLAAEHANLRHPLVLWYSHQGFAEGYAHRGWPLGHPAGGSALAWRGAVRWRPPGRGLELELAGGRVRWGERGQTPGRAERWHWDLSLRPAHGLDGWRAALGFRRERSAAWDAAWNAAARADWWCAEVSRSL